MYICMLKYVGMKKLYTFDFDGTLTTKDTLLEFIKYAKGGTALYAVLLLYSPLLVLMKLRLYSNQKVKEKVFSRLFKGTTLEAFDKLCRDFAHSNGHLLRKQATDYIYNNVKNVEGASMVIVSASIVNWVKPFFDDIIKVDVLGTEIEVKDGRLTGRFLSANCYGEEKVRRLLERFPDRSSYYITAFGDSRGDRELLAFADEAYFKPFRQ